MVAVTPTTLELGWLRPQAEVDRFVVSYVSAGNQRVRLEVPAEADRTLLTDLMPGVEYVVAVTAERGRAVSYPASVRANTGTAGQGWGRAWFLSVEAPSLGALLRHTDSSKCTRQGVWQFQSTCWRPWRPCSVPRVPGRQLSGPIGRLWAGVWEKLPMERTVNRRWWPLTELGDCPTAVSDQIL